MYGPLYKLSVSAHDTLIVVHACHSKIGALWGLPGVNAKGVVSAIEKHKVNVLPSHLQLGTCCSTHSNAPAQDSECHASEAVHLLYKSLRDLGHRPDSSTNQKSETRTR